MNSFFTLSQWTIFFIISLLALVIWVIKDRNQLLLGKRKYPPSFGTFLCIILLTTSTTGCKQDMQEPAILIDEQKKEAIETSPVFTRIHSTDSNLNFENNIAENIETNENLFNFDYFYNGAGVGIEDLNNDGLLDIFYCGNQVANKLFLNKGDLTFEDISDTAQINKGKNWSNGVTFVDINKDGYQDIYISQGGPGTREHRKNLLFINNKDLTFTERAEEYGLADKGISTQTAFFDFDNDGDLDCVVMNENEIYGVDPINFYKLVASSPENMASNSSHLYKNENGKFVDISSTSGLERPIFGLGLCISDINKDGWLDIYMTSDYYIPDALFVNNGNGTFTDKIKEYTNHISYYGMGVDIADINNDLKEDIFVLDMSSSDHVRSKTLMASMNTERFNYLTKDADFQHQYMFNSLQLNLGNTRYNNISQLTEMANTDWSWSVLMSDLDNDEDNDIYISNGYRKYALDNDLQQRVTETQQKYNRRVPNEVKKQLYESMPSEKLKNILYANQGDLKFQENATSWGLGDYSFSNGVAQGDLDNDGDLELIVNNIDENTFLYKNLTIENGLGNYLNVKPIGTTSEPFCTIKIVYQGKSQKSELKRVRGFMSAQENTVHFGLGSSTIIDTLTVTWLTGEQEEQYNLKANTTVVVDIKNATIPVDKNPDQITPFQMLDPKQIGLNFIHKENNYDDFSTEVLLPYKQSSFGPFMSKGDVNSDGKIDLYIGGAHGQPGELYVQKQGRYQKTKSPVFEEDNFYEDMESVFFDFDNDNDLDLYVVSGGTEFKQHNSYYSDRLYLNDGLGNFSKLNDPVLYSLPKNGKTVSIIDFDQDGDSDILIGNRSIPQKYPQHATSTLYENRNGTLTDVTKEKAFELLDFGIINHIISTDFDNDGLQDFIAVGEWTGIGFFKNNNGSFKLLKSLPLYKEKGWWYSITETDINKDGLKDYVIGNIGQNIKFKGDKKKPFKIFTNDFDNNGTNDIVLSKQYKGKNVPVRGRECSSQQMPFIKDKFQSYASFANASLEDIYEDGLVDAYKNEIIQFKSIVLLNRGDLNFDMYPLPAEAQQFPILKSVVYDINQDGYEDCILVGNIYDTEVETPRLDAVSGLILLSNKKDGYIPMNFDSSGLYLEGDTKDLLLTTLKNKPILLSTRNNSSLESYIFTKD